MLSIEKARFSNLNFKSYTLGATIGKGQGKKSHFQNGYIKSYAEKERRRIKNREEP